MLGEIGVPRIALDETSLDFRALDRMTLEDCLYQLSEALADIRSLGHQALVHPWTLDSVECLDEHTLDGFLFNPRASDVDRDLRLRLGVALDRCAKWPDELPGAIEAVELSPMASGSQDKKDQVELSFSLGIAAASPQVNDIAFLALGTAIRSDWWNISSIHGQARGFFFSRCDQLPRFWRRLYAAEDIQEQQFFEFAVYAFPTLLFHPDLRFNRFDGRYQDVRDKAVSILSTLNDHFSTALMEHNGLPAKISAELGKYGCDLSPESPNTRRSAKLMALRTVDFNGSNVSVEWHAKLERHRNRIHFSLPLPEFANKILIGIFTAHLDT